ENLLKTCRKNIFWMFCSNHAESGLHLGKVKLSHRSISTVTSQPRWVWKKEYFKKLFKYAREKDAPVFSARSRVDWRSERSFVSFPGSRQVVTRKSHGPPSSP